MTTRQWARVPAKLMIVYGDMPHSMSAPGMMMRDAVLDDVWQWLYLRYERRLEEITTRAFDVAIQAIRKHKIKTAGGDWDALLADVERSLRMARRYALSDMKRLLAEAENREKDELA